MPTTLDVRSNVRALYAMVETTYATDPDPDGSSYSPLPATDVSDPKEGKEPLPIQYADGTNYPSEAIDGPDSWELKFSTPAIGLNGAAGNGVNASTRPFTYMDLLLMHLFGARTHFAGSTIATGGSSVITLGTDTHDAGNILAVFEAAQLRAQAAVISAATGAQYDLEPDLEFAVTTAGVSYGPRVYSDVVGGGDTLAFCLVRGATRQTYLGGARTGVKLKLVPGKPAMYEWTFRGDTVIRETTGKASLPAALLRPPIPEIMANVAPVFINGMDLGEIGAVDIDFGVQPMQIASVHGTINGRAGDEVGRLEPTVTVNPIHDLDRYDSVRNAAGGRLLVQIGDGALAGGNINMQVLVLDNARYMKAEPQADGNLRRVQLAFNTANPGATGSYCRLALV